MITTTTLQSNGAGVTAKSRSMGTRQDGLVGWKLVLPIVLGLLAMFAFSTGIMLAADHGGRTLRNAVMTTWLLAFFYPISMLFLTLVLVRIGCQISRYPPSSKLTSWGSNAPGLAVGVLLLAVFIGLKILTGMPTKTGAEALQSLLTYFCALAVLVAICEVVRWLGREITHPALSLM
ncbi:MAG: hypothetical protein HY220_02115 [Candidatus Sungbacteria bacterium]|uniref:Uncharacterized protein n=1 Tax=Candidatus Sungiibacteriota bacterium TaxID=2750080 RepID=A0A9D6LN32_9BACT|nr:hypothetical protein [Candidatus Sungbacteria bacterium]